MSGVKVKASAGGRGRGRDRGLAERLRRPAGRATWAPPGRADRPTPPGAAGATGVAGTFGRGGAGGTGGHGGSGFGEPACLSTVAKGGACTSVDQQVCYKTCGPEKTGVKSETCTGGVYYGDVRLHLRSGQGLLLLPDPDGRQLRPARRARRRMASTPCDVPHCTLCNSLQGVVGGQYLDAGGAPKVGWCVCQEPNAAGAADLELRQRHRVALPARRRLHRDGRQPRHRRARAAAGTGGGGTGGGRRLRRARLSVHGRQGWGVHGHGSAVLLQDVRAAGHRREGRDLHDGRHLRRDVGLLLRPEPGLLLLQDSGDRQRGLSPGVTPQASGRLRGPAVHALQQPQRRNWRTVPRLGRRAQGRLVRLPAAERVGRPDLELRERHLLAVPARRRLLRRRSKSGPLAPAERGEG